MENESSIKEIIRNALEEVRTVMDADTIVGQPVKLDNGATVIPISKVSMGFASGGLDLPNKAEVDGKKNFGGGGGTGVSVMPIGFLTAYPDGRVELLPLKPEQSTAIEQVADIINRTPEIIGKIKDLFEKKPAEKTEKTEKKAEEAKKPAASPVAPVAPKSQENDLTDKMLTSMAQDENLAVVEPKEEEEEEPAPARPTKAEKAAQKAARKKEAANQKKAKREEARRKASFDYADED